MKLFLKLILVLLLLFFVFIIGIVYGYYKGQSDYMLYEFSQRFKEK